MRIVDLLYKSGFALLIFLTFSLFGEGFKKGTLVKTNKGKVAIEEVKEGDRVMSLDKEGRIVASVVKAVKAKKVDKFVAIAVSKAMIEADPDQQLYVLSKENWIKARDLQAADTILSAVDGSTAINTVEEIQYDSTVYSLSIEENHNFFVSDSEILVHNFLVGEMVIVGTAVATNPVVVAEIVESVVYIASTTALLWTGWREWSKGRSSSSTSRNSPPPTSKNDCKKPCGKCTKCLQEKTKALRENLQRQQRKQDQQRVQEQQKILGQKKNEQKDRVELALAEAEKNKKNFVHSPEKKEISVKDIVAKNLVPASGGDDPNNDRKCWCGHFCGGGCPCDCFCKCGNRNREIERVKEENNKKQKENDTDENGRKRNTVNKQDFFKSKAIADNYEHVRNGVYRLKKGGTPIVKGANLLQWDHLHGDVEVWNQSEEHLGSLDPEILEIYRGPQGHEVGL